MFTIIPFYIRSVCIAASGGNQFRGFAIQARETSVDFASSSSNPLVGAFTNAPAVGGDWQIWSCPGGVSIYIIYTCSNGTLQLQYIGIFIHYSSDD